MTGTWTWRLVNSGGASAWSGCTWKEDVAKLQHVTGDGAEPYTLVDVNRSGVPLMEVVSRPDMRSAEEARLYLMGLHAILQYTGVSTANMQEGKFRCDTNVSLRPTGSDQLGGKVEVKNLNSFRSVFYALKYEVERQKRVLDEGGAGRARDTRLVRGKRGDLLPAVQGVCPRLPLFPRA